MIENIETNSQMSCDFRCRENIISQTLSLDIVFLLVFRKAKNMATDTSALLTYAALDLLAQLHPDRYSRPVAMVCKDETGQVIGMSISQSVSDKPIVVVKHGESLRIAWDPATSPPHVIDCDDFQGFRSLLSFLQINDAIYQFVGGKLQFVCFSNCDLRTPDAPRWVVGRITSPDEPDRSYMTATDLSTVTIDGVAVTLMTREGKLTIA